ncbi:MAG: phosphatidylserine decarboxylase [Sphingomonadales bacterium]|nr:phosphatidylserine decarboxylase [Sphingomonadales bacterium]
MFSKIIPPIHPEGHKFAAVFLIVTLLFFWMNWTVTGWIGVVLTLWCLYFFRDPVRVTPDVEGLVIAPADGLVLPLVTVTPPLELGLGDAPRVRISIFMNVFDVHVNRAPTSGTIKTMCYIPGKFVNASLDKASVDNERQLLAMELADGKTIGFVQIAGLVARRILCFVSEGQKMEAGERFGLIRFGSRVDVYLDPSMTPMVIDGQRTIAGETVIADSRHDESERTGIAS